MARQPWNWAVFWPAFWSGFGRMSAAFLIGLLALTPFVDPSALNVAAGLGFAAVCAALYGASEGDEAVTRWRNGELPNYPKPF